MSLQMKSTLWDVSSSSVGPDLVSHLALVSFVEPVASATTQAHELS